jgi:DNA-binding NarL/FixJ family response regulator
LKSRAEPKTRVLLADDHKIVRDGLRALLENQPQVQVVAEAEDGDMTVRLAKELRPDVVVMDVAMPGMDGIEATRQIAAQFPDMKVLTLSMHSDRRFVRGMLSAGASGYMLKDCAFRELVDGIRAVAAGRIYLSPGVAGMVVEDYVSDLTNPSHGTSDLTARKRDVLRFVADGRTTREIASDLHISVKTVEAHRRQIMQKLDIRSIAELTKYAVREGLSSLEM